MLAQTLGTTGTCTVIVDPLSSVVGSISVRCFKSQTAYLEEVSTTRYLEVVLTSSNSHVRFFRQSKRCSYVVQFFSPQAWGFPVRVGGKWKVSVSQGVL